jgi:hypothetical protein
MAERHERERGNVATEDGDVDADTGSSLAATVVTGAVVALLAPELLPGMALGVAAVMAPRIMPSLGNVFRPLLKTAVRAGYATVNTTRELAAEAGEQMQDMMAEVRAEQESSRAEAEPGHGARKATKARRAHA